MRINIHPGRYVLGVSGGVDSMSLLHILAARPDLEIVVAHFNHNIRPNSKIDEQLVKKITLELGLPIKIGQANLGELASEATARAARYEFLEKVLKSSGAQKIITAHHQDDLIETAILNLIRGTGQRGLVAIGLNPKIIRPLLNVPKTEILNYAKANHLNWVEDETNNDQKYLRNKVRAMLASNLTPKLRAEILTRINQANINNRQLDTIFDELLPNLFDEDDALNRQAFILLPNNVSEETMIRWLRARQISVDRPTIKRLVIAAKTAKPGSRHNVANKLKLTINQKRIYLTES